MDDFFAGFVTLEDTLVGMLLTRNSSGVPTDADALPTFRVYGPDGLMLTGTCALLDSSNTDGCYSYSIAATALNTFEAGVNYNVLFSYAVGASNRGANHSFQVA